MDGQILSSRCIALSSCLDVDGKLLAGSEGVILDLLLGNALEVAALLLVG